MDKILQQHEMFVGYKKKWNLINDLFFKKTKVIYLIIKH